MKKKAKKPMGLSKGPIVDRGQVVAWYLDVAKLLREIRKKAIDAHAALSNDDSSAAKAINGYLKSDFSLLYKLWTRRYPDKELGYLGRHIAFGELQDYSDILSKDIPQSEEFAEQHLLESQAQIDPVGFESLLHPIIWESSYALYRGGHLRDAVLNAFTAVFDLIRKRTNLDMDGAKLAGQVFSLTKPHLILSEVETESGRNDQIGFLQIYQGAYTGIRNPKAHSLQHDLTMEKAAQYLIFASLLARRVEEAKNV